MEDIRHITVWNNCLEIISQIVEPQKFDTWFRPLKPVSFDGTKLVVEVPTDFFREYLESAYLDVLKVTLKRVIGTGAKLSYKVRTVSTQPAMEVPAAEASTPVNRSVTVSTYPTDGNPGPFVFPGLKKVQIDPRLNPVYCFANFVVGECNKLGFSAGESISDKPGGTPFNPLFIFGGSGLGKTHLAQAIGLSIKEKYPDKVVLYVTGNQFKTQFMNAVVRNKITEFMAFYMKIEVLIVDDIQDLIGQGTQNAFFNIFNHLHGNGNQLIFTSDRSPVDLQNFEMRLLSRMKWGLSVELRRPSFETRLEMLKARCYREGVTISEEVLMFLASSIRSSFRELEGAVVSLLAHSVLLKQEITIDMAREFTEKIVGEQREELTIGRVKQTVCDYFKISQEELTSKSRKRKIVEARQIAMYMSRSHINCSLSTVGAEMGGKDHATVLHACNTVTDLMSTSRAFKNYINDIERLLVVV